MVNLYVNQAGFYPDSEKYALSAYKFEEFSIKDEQGNICYTGKAAYFGQDECSGDEVYSADFSDFRKEGRYYVETAEGRSYSFEIGDKCLNEALCKMEKAFYYLRCGCELKPEHAGKFTHAACHTGKARLWSDHSVELEATGGWHDAGDYGRYITAAACAVSHLLYAYKFYPQIFDGQNLNIPESDSAVPDILEECRYEIEWMMKLQRADGGVYHKLTTAAHADFVMPEEDRGQLYLFDVSSMATADLAAVCALASGIYRPFDSEFAERLIGAAEKSYGWLKENPEFLGFRNPEGNSTGGYYEFNDRDNRFWAACEMFAATGDEKYHDDLKNSLREQFPLTHLGYGSVGGFGLMAYLFCERKECDEGLYGKFKSEMYRAADNLVKISEKCGYRTAMYPGEYCWGSNMNLMKNGMTFAIAQLLADMDGLDRDYIKYAARQMNTLLGANALGYSYVSGIGEHCINYPHLRPAYADGIDECIPGMVSGGPNGRPCPSDREVVSFPEDTPPMKCFEDDYRCFSLNEITIYWNSPAVFTAAALENIKRTGNN